MKILLQNTGGIQYYILKAYYYCHTKAYEKQRVDSIMKLFSNTKERKNLAME